jgi:hypothetical protein
MQCMQFWLPPQSFASDGYPMMYMPDGVYQEIVAVRHKLLVEIASHDYESDQVQKARCRPR